ncbi:MAG: stage II sporulation protein R [Clostridia bacterium]|nr:stage II sporulation protein R [Clostridia bacterium]
MKKYLIPAAALFTVCGILFSFSFRKTEEEKAMDSVIRLHIRAADDSEEEQTLKLKVRDEILNCTTRLLQDCNEKSQAKSTLQTQLSTLQKAGQRVVSAEGKDHSVTVSLERETFEYREYDGFFLPEGEYDSLIVTIGSGEGQNWWCVVFPAACYMGAAEMETNEKEMPSCFRLATKPAENVTVKFWLWEKIKGLFD